MESIVAKNVRKHLDKHNLMNHSQHSFMKGKSCHTNMLGFYSKVYGAEDNGDNYDILCLDFSKAFDNVLHQSLLRKATGLGCSGWREKYRLDKIVVS